MIKLVATLLNQATFLFIVLICQLPELLNFFKLLYLKVLLGYLFPSEFEPTSFLFVENIQLGPIHTFKVRTIGMAL